MPRPLETPPARRLAGFACVAGLVLFVLAGTHAPTAASAGWRDWVLFRSQSPDEEKDEERAVTSGTSLDTPYIGEYVTSFGGTNLIPVEGVGLVVGLDNTGEDPPPSHYRSRLVDEMRKQKIENPNEILARPDTAMVLIRAYIPVTIRKGDPFDAHVFLPPNSKATSLAGGWLLEARLAENRVVQGGRIAEGHVLASVGGPILTSLGGEGATSASLRTGKVLGGAKSRIDRDLAISLRSDFKSSRMSHRIAESIGKRFHGHDRHGVKIPMAAAKSDLRIELKVPDEYRENYPRYLSVIRNMAFREDEIAQRVRIQKLEQQIRVPAESEVAALRLEAIGPTALPALRKALADKDLEVRFNAAMALTYMGHEEGLETLAEAARLEPAFRVYALAALACCKEAEAAAALHTLLGEGTAETRYGAFRALTVLNENDPAVAGRAMTGGEKEFSYKLHVLEVGGPPLVHLTHHTKAEVVLFGARQALQLPATLRCGPHIQIVASSGSDEVVVARYSGEKAGRRVVSASLADIIDACDQLGAMYPDVASMLVQAESQHNLAGELEIDALPEAGRVYLPQGEAGGKRTIGSKYTAPNILAPPNSEAAAAREEDVREVPGEEVPGEERDEAETKADGIRLTSGDEEKTSGVVTAGLETPAGEPAEPSEEARPQGEEAAPSQEGKTPWYRALFKRPAWTGGSGPPQQFEPEPE